MERWGRPFSPMPCAGCGRAGLSAVADGHSANAVLDQVIVPGADWELVGEGYGFTEGTAADAAGNVYFQDIPASKTYRVAPAGGGRNWCLREAQRASGTCIGTDGSRYEVAGGSKQVLKYEVGGAVKVIANGIAGNDLVVDHNGNVYVTAPDGTERPGKIWLIRPGGQPVVVDSGLKFVNGLCPTPDQTQLYVAESASHWIWVFMLSPMERWRTSSGSGGPGTVPDDKDKRLAGRVEVRSERTYLCGDEYGDPGIGISGVGRTRSCRCRRAASSRRIFVLAGRISMCCMCRRWGRSGSGG